MVIIFALFLIQFVYAGTVQINPPNPVSPSNTTDETVDIVPPVNPTNYSVYSNYSFNSDKLDGYHASYFYPASNPNSYITDGNTLWDNIYGFVTGTNLANNLSLYYLNSNPSNFYNSTTLPATNLSGYLLANGSTALTGQWNYGTQNINGSGNITIGGVLTNNIPANYTNGLKFNSIYSGTDNVNMYNFNLANTITSSGTGLNLLSINNSVTNNHAITGFTLVGTNQTTRSSLNKVTSTGAHSVTSTGVQTEYSYASDNQVYGGDRTITATTTTILEGVGTKNYVDYKNINGVSAVDVINAYGEKTNVIATALMGNPTSNIYGNWIDVQGSTTGTSNAYGLYINAVTGADNNYGIYDLSGANWIMKSNNQKLLFGSSSQASCYYNSTDFICNPKEVGSGSFYILGNINNGGYNFNTNNLTAKSGNFVGNLNQTNGNATINNIYGGMYYHNYTATTLNFASSGVYYSLFFTVADMLNGFGTEGVSFGGTSNLTAQVSGVYHLTFFAIGDGINNHEYHIVPFINSTEQDKCESMVKLSATGDKLNMVGNCLIRLSVGDRISLRVADYTGTGNGNYYGANINLVRVGS